MKTTWTPAEARRAVEGLGPPGGGSYARDEIINAWQSLIDGDHIEVLGGWFERAANQLIAAGICKPKEAA